MDNSLYEQALGIAEAVPRLIRRFFAIETEGPAADLPVAQLRIVSILYSGRQTMSALSSQLGISLSAVTQVADRLERSGLVERVVEEGDHRVKCLQLTPHGREAVAARNERRVQRILEVLREMSAEDRNLAVAGMRLLSERAAGNPVTEPEAESAAR